jgi:hypothetical protein
MNSKKIGPMTVLEKTCRRTLVVPPSTAPSPSGVLLHPIDWFSVAAHAPKALLIIRFWGSRHELQAVVRERVGRIVDGVGADRDVLNAFALVPSRTYALASYSIA